MNRRQLIQFLNLAEQLHFGRAAELVNVSPSALSRSIQRLEAELGTALFDRDNRNVSLTQAGRRFLEYARETVRGWDSIRNELLAGANELQGEVSLFCSVTASYSYLVEILEAVRAEHPAIEITLHTGDPEDAISRVLSGRDDLAIALRPEKMPAGLAFRALERLPLVFIQGRETAVDKQRDWSATPMILNERGVTRTRVTRWFEEKGQSLNIYAQVAGNEAIVGMVSLGFGVGVVPGIVLENSPLAGKVRVLDVRPQLEPCEVGLVSLDKNLSRPLVRVFWDAHR
jgi:LysR family positive regulator for ilvC